MLKASKRPVLMAGGGILLGKASEELAGLRTKGENPRHSDPHGSRRLPGIGPAFSRHAGNARHLFRQHGDQPMRSAHRTGRRFDDRVTGKIDTFRRQREDHPHRRGPVVHQQEHRRRCAHRERREERPRRTSTASSRTRTTRPPTRTACRVVRADRRLEENGAAQLHARMAKDHQAPVRHRDALRSDKGQGHHHDRSGPEPDVGGPVLQVRRSQHVHLLRRPGNDGLRLPGGHRRASSPSPTDRSWTSPATAASR